MFAIFSLRRPDILPVGDLGTQRGLLYWVLSSHAPEQYPLRLNPRRLPKPDEDDAKTVKTEAAQTIERAESTSILPGPATPKKTKSRSALSESPPVGPSLSSGSATQTIPRTPTPKVVASGSKQSGKTDFDEQANEKVVSLIPPAPVPLPEGITLEILKSRANGKKVKGGNYLLPSEMEALTKSWEPYRSLGAYKGGQLLFFLIADELSRSILFVVHY
jgi:DNA-3-methyladenine glycosylase II